VLCALLGGVSYLCLCVLLCSVVIYVIYLCERYVSLL